MHIHKRISSIDALRGLTVAAMLLVNDAGDWDHVYPWLEHSEWNGCTPADFIFPFFLLIVGVSIQLALGPKAENALLAAERKALVKAVIWRGARIFLLGLLLHLLAAFMIDGQVFRLLGVLQRIGVCFAAAGMITIYMKQAFLQYVLFATILLGYWGLLQFSGGYAPNINLADRIDTAVLGRLSYTFDPITALAHDPEGILSTLPSFATVILGLRAGALLRKGHTLRLILIGFIMMAVGYVWSHWVPLNKQLWTSSFVCWTGGAALLSIGIFHYLIDIRSWPAIGRSFGVNAITAYAGSWIAVCLLSWLNIMNPLYFHWFSEPLTAQFSAEFASFAFSLTFTCLFGIAMWFCNLLGWRVVI
ncbi:acyltransferase family protein [Fluviispira multicolorata]|uniref:DUF5009 domain-containing protein n=1 Tax=Fluviispira multicolorata TaxID=2654512 RepID=A0A833JFW1_9BACT|nr:heparan-alpha-glucosaminide N-acetyltransferase domain-containing protein [Fluviispira multicolorata]KAB8033618.1 DUF5009 domain-containing protein [Fluviispira multicolorata]